MKKKKLKEAIDDGYSQRDISRIFNKSQTTVRYWINKYELSTRKDPKSHLCEKCGEDDSNNFYGHQKSICKKCRNTEDLEKKRQYKQEAIDYLGGKCKVCGYDKCNQALEFHHLEMDEKSKEYESMKNWSFERKREELNKCILICCRCHREIHYLNPDIV